MFKNQIIEFVSENCADNNNLKKMDQQVQPKTEIKCIRKSQKKRSAKNQLIKTQMKKRKVEVKPKPIHLEESVMSLICLNDDMLREILRYLNWFDAINLAGSCNRLRYLNYSWADKKLQEFDLDKYLYLRKNANISFPQIAPHIGILKTSVSNINKTLMKYCENINSLYINDNISPLNASRINKWIKKLNLESLRFHHCDYVDKLLNDVSGLKELEINVLQQNSSSYIEKNQNLERLSIEVDNNFNFGVLQKLQYLKCLHIRTSDLTDIGEIQKFGNLGDLAEFSVLCQTFSDEPEILQSFLEHLAENKKVNKLGLVDCSINNGIFNTLKLFSLKALNLCDDFDEDEFTKFIEEYSAPLLKHLKLSNCTCEQLYNLINKWTNLQTICVYTGNDVDHEKILDKEFIRKISKISQNRPPIRIHVRNGRQSEHPIHIEVVINFSTKQFNVVVQDDDFCCSTTKFFAFGDECFWY